MSSKFQDPVFRYNCQRYSKVPNKPVKMMTSDEKRAKNIQRKEQRIIEKQRIQCPTGT